MQKTILICDDDKLTVELVSFSLVKAGYKVVHVHECESVWHALAEEKPDAVLMDLWVPEMGGMAATMALKRYWGQSLKIIMISTAFDLPRAAKEAGADAYLHKPFRVDQLMELVERCLASEN